MKDYVPSLVTGIWITGTFALDVATTLAFLGSPNCVEGNPFFAPFSANRGLLLQAYFTAWFFSAGSLYFVYRLGKFLQSLRGVSEREGRILLHATTAAWLAVNFYWGYNHLWAAIWNHAILPLCWA